MHICLTEQPALWAYFYGFVSVLTVANIIFFGLVTHILIKAQRSNRTILKTTSRQEKERYISTYFL